MDLFPNMGSTDVVLIANDSKEDFDIQFDSVWYVIPAGAMVRVPRSHYTHVMTRPGAQGTDESPGLRVVNMQKGNAEYLAAERKRKTDAIESLRVQKELLDQQLANLEAEHGVAPAKSDPPAKGDPPPSVPRPPVSRKG